MIWWGGVLHLGGVRGALNRLEVFLAFPNIFRLSAGVEVQIAAGHRHEGDDFGFRDLVNGDKQ